MSTADEPGAAATAVIDDADRLITLAARIGGLDEVHSRLGRADAARLQVSCLELLSAEVAKQHGTIAQAEGGRLVASFAGDGATIRALRAALAMQPRIDELKDELGRTIWLRVGVCAKPNTPAGLPLQLAAFGTQDPADIAWHLHHPCAIGGPICTYAIHRNVRGLFDVRALDPICIRGRGEPVPLYEVLRERPGGVRLPIHTVLATETRLWGREPELAELKRLVDRSLSERRVQGALVLGEPGVGKTRLIHELARYVQSLSDSSANMPAHNATLLWTRCVADGPPYGVIGDLVVRRAAIVDALDPREARVQFRAMVNDVLIDRRRRGRRQEDHPPEVPSEQDLAEFTQRAALLGYLVGLPFDEDPAVVACAGKPRLVAARGLMAARNWLEALMRQGPVVLIVEEVHLADPGSLRFLIELCDELKGPLALVCVSSSFVVPSGLRGRLQTIILSALDDEAAGELVEQTVVVSGEGARALQDDLIQRGGGNPLLLEELVVHAVERVGETLPVDLDAAVSARLRGLSDGERHLLRRAAVLGEVFDLAGLTALTEAATPKGSPPPIDTVDILRRLCAKGLIIRADELRRQSYRFRHRLYREALLAGLVGAASVESRAKLSSHAAAYLESHSRETAGRGSIAGPPERIARHLADADWPGPAVVHALRAIDVALERDVPEVAGRILEWLIPLVGQSVGPAALSELLLRAVEVAHVRQDVAQERVLLDRLASLIEPATASLLRARIALAEVRAARRGGNIARAVEYANYAVVAAERAAREHHHGDSIATSADAAPLHFFALLQRGDVYRAVGDFKVAQDSYAEGRSRAERRGDRAAAAAARVKAALVRCDEDGDDVAMAELEAAARSAGDLGDEALRLEATAGLIAGWRRLGRFDRAFAESEEGIQLARSLGDRLVTAKLYSELGQTHFRAGDLRAGLWSLEQALDELASAPADDREADAIADAVELFRSQLLLKRGDYADLGGVERTCDRLVSVARNVGRYDHLAAALSCLGQAVGRRGGLERALALSNEALALVVKYPVPHELGVAVRLGHAVLLREAGKADSAADLDGQAHALIRARADRLSTPSARAAYLAAAQPRSLASA